MVDADVIALENDDDGLLLNMEIVGDLRYVDLTDDFLSVAAASVAAESQFPSTVKVLNSR